MARLVLVFGSRWIPQIFYVDSGADITLLPKSVGTLLGLKVTRPDEIREIKGVGDRGVPIVVRRVGLRLGERSFKARIAWCMIEEAPPLLGRLDLFPLFDIVFARGKRTVFRN